MVKKFEKIKLEILTALGPLAVSVEHVGSTAVKGLWAKPIIDIDVVISEILDIIMKAILASVDAKPFVIIINRNLCSIIYMFAHRIQKN